MWVPKRGSLKAAGKRHFLVPAIPQSEVLAKFFEEIGETCGDILAKFFADSRPSISRENGRKTFHEKSSTFSTVHQIKFFHCCNSGGLGAQHFPATQLFNVALQFLACCSAAFGQNDICAAEKPMLQCNFCSAAFRKLQLPFSLVACCRGGV